jgi:hypothetical protein
LVRCTEKNLATPLSAEKKSQRRSSSFFISPKWKKVVFRSSPSFLLSLGTGSQY